MKIHITKAGRVLVVCFIIGVVIFFMFGGAAVVAKIVEGHRVNSLPSVADVFSNSDISYRNWNTLKKSFKERHEEVSVALSKAKELQQKYPKNEKLLRKKKNYEQYLQLMEIAAFPCPEHNRPRICSNCNGKGKTYYIFTCGVCKGSGTIRLSDIQKQCPYCHSISQSNISGKDLLN